MFREEKLFNALKNDYLKQGMNYPLLFDYFYSHFLAINTEKQKSKGRFDQANRPVFDELSRWQK